MQPPWLLPQRPPQATAEPSGKAGAPGNITIVEGDDQDISGKAVTKKRQSRYVKIT